MMSASAWLATVARERSAGQVERDLGLGQPVGHGSGVLAAMAGVKHDYPSDQTMAGASDELFFTQGVRRPPGHRSGQVGESPQGRGADAAVDHQSDAPLKASNRLLGVGTEHAVDPVGGCLLYTSPSPR